MPVALLLISPPSRSKSSGMISVGSVTVAGSFTLFAVIAVAGAAITVLTTTAANKTASFRFFMFCPPSCHFKTRSLFSEPCFYAVIRIPPILTPGLIIELLRK